MYWKIISTNIVDKILVMSIINYKGNQYDMGV